MVSGKRTRLALLVLVLAVAAAAGAVGYLRWSATAPTGVAIINGDTGKTGATIVKALQDSGSREWTEVDSASTDDYAVIVTLPTDLSDSIASLATDKPHKAQVEVTSNDNADANLVNEAVNEVTKKIGASGLDTLFASMNSARGQVSQVALTANILGAGVQAAADGASQFTGSADEMRSFLEQAKTGASQLTSGIDSLNTTLNAATLQANQLAATLDSTGVTIGQVTSTASQLSNGLNIVLPVLRGLPFAADPQLAAVITQLEGLQNIANQANDQLSGFAALTGTAVTPDTQVGQLLRDAASRLGDAGSQLNQGADLAKSIPGIADTAGAQLTTAIATLTSGVTQLQAVTTTLGNQANQALDTLPQRTVGQQSQIATMLADPVDIVRK
ncbi:hypothetical protein [Nocardia inohanensis]|uniref:hypothetical protein n=1 Tax=Nocardia inohanensis TaxID=209246 RepID=UPI000A8B8634|nr:hypothetical protein [Nocardia inohanensis]